MIEYVIPGPKMLRKLVESMTYDDVLALSHKMEQGLEVLQMILEEMAGSQDAV